MIEITVKPNKFMEHVHKLYPPIDGKLDGKFSYQRDFGLFEWDRLEEKDKYNIIMRYTEDALLRVLMPQINRRVTLDLRLKDFSDRPDQPTKHFDFQVFVSPSEDLPIIYKLVEGESSLPPDVYKCNFCVGYTENDLHGCCRVCHAPRGWKL